MYEVIVGEHRIAIPEGTETTHRIREIYEHPKYDNKTNENDLALLRMEEPIVFTREVMAACLAESPRDINKFTCMVVGWGLTNGELHFLRRTSFISRHDYHDTLQCVVYFTF